MPDGFEVQQQSPEQLIAALTERCRQLEAQGVAARLEVAALRLRLAEAKPRRVEHYYAPAALAVKLDVAPRTIVDWAKAGEFGSGVINLCPQSDRGDWRIPESGVLAFIERRRLFAGLDCEPAR